MSSCESFSSLLAATILQLVSIIPGVLWFFFVARGLQKSRHVQYLGFAWLAQGFMYAIQAMLCPMLTSQNFQVTATDAAVLAGKAAGVLTVVDSSISLLSSSILLMAWYMMRDLRLGIEHAGRDTEPTMPKWFVFSLAVGLATALSTFLLFVEKVVNNPLLQGVYMVIDVFMAAAAGVLIGVELGRCKFLDERNNVPLFSERGFVQAKYFAALAFIVWGVAQLAHILSSLSDFEAFVYPSGVFYDFLAVMKLICAAAAGGVALHALPETERFRHINRKVLR